VTPARAPASARLAARAAWSLRVRRVGGFIQVAFAAFWLVRGSLTIDDGAGTGLAAASAIAIIAVVAYGIRATSGTAPRPSGPEGRHIERAVTIATVVQLAASFAAPAIVIADGHSDWMLPSIAVTIGPLLLVALMSGTALAATTGITAGLVLLGIAAAGFHDLAARHPGQAPGVLAVPPLGSAP
jgi:hypothetical protein